MTAALDLVNKIHANVDARQVTAVNIAAFCQHTCTTSLERITKVALDLSQKPEFKPTASEKFEILSGLWNIVDSLNTMRSAIESDKRFLKSLLDKPLADRLVAIRRLRNYKSHISENINNITSKGTYFPPLGVGKWFMCYPDEHPHDLKIFMVSADAMFMYNSHGKISHLKVDSLDGADGQANFYAPVFVLQTDKEALNLSWTVELAEQFFLRAASYYEKSFVPSVMPGLLAEPLEGLGVVVVRSKKP